jgi:hypothetical protein
MAKTQRKIGEASAPRAKSSPHLQIIREGEPIPELAAQPIRKPRLRRVRSSASSNAAQHCPLCDGLITRFDGESYSLHGSCSPCHEALGAR